MSTLRQRRTAEDEHDKRSNPSSLPDDRSRRNDRNIVGLIGVKAFKIFLVLISIYCILVFLFYSIYPIRHQMVYLNYLVNPFLNYSDPESRGLSNTRNFYIQGHDGKLGVWHVLAKDSSVIDDGKPVVLYMHGNAFSRNAKHRIGLYKVLSSIGCHVVALDYRGFGDSEGFPTEQGLIDDSLTTFKWIKDHANNSPIFLWGHSLGSGVAVGVGKLLSQTDTSVLGLILEAPFNNMKEAAIGHPLSQPIRFLPNFPGILQEINDLFKSDEAIVGVTVPIIILHDHEDEIVPFALGRKLYEAALKGQQSSRSVELKEFRGYGHKKLYESKELPGILRTFMNLRSEEKG